MAEWAVRAGMSHAALKQEDLLLGGHRLVSVAAYGLPSSPSYAAIWHPVTGSPPRPRQLIESYSTAAPVDAGADLPPGVIPPLGQVAPTLVTATGDARPNGELGTATLWVYDVYGNDEDLPVRTTIITDSVNYLLGKIAGLRCISMPSGSIEKSTCSAMQARPPAFATSP